MHACMRVRCERTYCSQVVSHRSIVCCTTPAGQTPGVSFNSAPARRQEVSDQKVSTPYGTPPASRACIDHLRRPSRSGLKSPSIPLTGKHHGGTAGASLVHLRKTEPPARQTFKFQRRPFPIFVVRSGARRRTTEAFPFLAPPALYSFPRKVNAGARQVCPLPFSGNVLWFQRPAASRTGGKKPGTSTAAGRPPAQPMCRFDKYEKMFVADGYDTMQ